MSVASKLCKILANRIYHMPSKRYLTYIRSPEWTRRRHEHLGKHPYCELCKLRRSMQVHHWNYRNLGNEKDEDLCAVCVWCHHDVHCNVGPPANDNQQIAFTFEETG